MKLHIQTQNDWPRELQNAGLSGYGAEVGVLRGEFSKKLLSGWSGKRLYMIDSWRYVPGTHDANNADQEGQKANMAEAFRSVYPFGDRAVIVRDLSVFAAQLFPDGVLDFVYIDAAHDYRSVSADLNAWVPKVRTGGVVCGDDYMYGTWSHGKINGQDAWTDFEVKPAVDDYVKREGRELFLSEEEKPQWWFFK